MAGAGNPGAGGTSAPPAGKRDRLGGVDRRTSGRTSIAAEFPSHPCPGACGGGENGRSAGGADRGDEAIARGHGGALAADRLAGKVYETQPSLRRVRGAGGQGKIGNRRLAACRAGIPAGEKRRAEASAGRRAGGGGSGETGGLGQPLRTLRFARRIGANLARGSGR